MGYLQASALRRLQCRTHSAPEGPPALISPCTPVLSSTIAATSHPGTYSSALGNITHTPSPQKNAHRCILSISHPASQPVPPPSSPTQNPTPLHSRAQPRPSHATQQSLPPPLM